MLTRMIPRDQISLASRAYGGLFAGEDQAMRHSENELEYEVGLKGGERVRRLTRAHNAY